MEPSDLFAWGHPPFFELKEKRAKDLSSQSPDNAEPTLNDTKSQSAVVNLKEAQGLAHQDLVSHSMFREVQMSNGIVCEQGKNRNAPFLSEKHQKRDTRL